jgi:PKD repeat protein
LTYAWDFNYDGRTFTQDASGRTARHIYQDGPASIVAALQVRDGDGGETIDTVTVEVSNVPPTIIGVTTSGPTGEGLPITLAVEATDPGNDTLTYAFDWTNDGTYDLLEQSATLSNTWYSDGDFTVGIRVYDDDNGEVFTTTVVSTFNLTPTAVAAVPDTTFFEGAKVPFDSTQSSDPGSDDPLTFFWDFGDGSDVQSLDGADSGYAYADNGVYTATLTVVDDDGASDSDTVSVEVLNANPTVNAGPDLEIAEGLDVRLTFGGSASDAGSDELTFVWDLDYDGTSFDEDELGPTVTELYPQLDGPGQYSVALRVRDDDYPYSTEMGGQIGENLDTLNVIIRNTPPKNVKANGPYLTNPGQPVELVASEAEDVPGDTLSYEWDLDYDGSTFDTDATGRAVKHTWSTAGLYEVSLRVSDEDGGESLDTALVNVNAEPVARAGGPYSGREGSAVILDGGDSSDPDGDSLSYLWDFGDGSPSTSGITVTHAYPDNGVYTATLTVIDQHEATASASASVAMVNVNPVADAGSDTTADEGSALNLAASATTDPGSGDTLTYAWDFDYDGVTFNEDATGLAVTVTYPDGPLTRTVALRVRDDDYPYTLSGGEPGEDFDVLTVAVNNIAPGADAGGPYLTQEGEPVNLTGTGFDVPADTLGYEWDLNYDGTNFTSDATGQTVSNIWPTYGVYQVALRVTDKDGGTGLNLAQVDVNSSPVAGAGGPYSGDEGSQITLTGSGLDTDSDTFSFAWDLDNDGEFETPGRVVTHVWPDDGLYPVSIRVDDGRGGLATAQATVSINNVAPSADAGPDQTLFEGAVVSLAGAAADPGADELTYEWDFNYDGITFNVDSVGQSATTSYPNGPAAFTVALRVTDDDGGSALDTLLVTVDNAPPTAAAGGPYVATAGIPITLSGTGTDVPDDTLTFVWDLDNDGSFESQGQDVSFINTTPGSYTVVLQVADNEGGIATDTTTVQVTPVTE